MEEQTDLSTEETTRICTEMSSFINGTDARISNAVTAVENNHNLIHDRDVHLSQASRTAAPSLRNSVPDKKPTYVANVHMSLKDGGDRYNVNNHHSEKKCRF